MFRSGVNSFIPVGLFALVAGILLRLFTHGNYSHFAGGFLIGVSIVWIIVGFVRQSRSMTM